MSPPTWQSIRDRKQADRACRIPREWLIPLERLPHESVRNVIDVPRTCGVLTRRELHITDDLDARNLAKAIRGREFTATEVTVAFCKRAAIIHQLTNSISEPLFSSALSRARELDDYFSTTGKTLGVLHGCPISVKDSFHVRGVDSCAGIAALAFNPALSNALLVDVLLEAGAVIHCKTNVPQGLGALDSVSNVFGRTLNPWNRLDLTAGGSSGGEGVLVAMRGSVMGCGTDVGGSLRIPGMCTGVIGFKPSLGRVPYGGQESGDEKAASRVQLQASAGPICNSVDDVGVFMEVIERARVWERDPDIVPGKWAADEDTGNDGGGKNLLMGVLRRDGLIDPLPPVNKVLDDVVSMLRRKGVEVVEVEAPKWKDCQAVANRFLGAGSGAHFFHLLEKTGEPLIPWLRGRTKKKDAISLDGLRELYVKKTYLEHAFLDIWRDQEGRRVDAMICPVAPHPVPPIDRWNGVSYTETWNLLDYPAANLPVRLFNEDDIEGEVSKGEPLSSWDRVNRDLWNEKKTNRSIYLGTPLGVQVVVPKLQERRLYQAMEVVEQAIKWEQLTSKL